MSIAIVIPARYASSRLPGKPLLQATGQYLIEHVYERACQARCADEVIVATDDDRIRDAVLSFGGRAVMTRSDHPSGTDRVAEVARGLTANIIVNLQGDEPTLEAESIDLLVELLERDAGSAMATLAVPITDRVSYLSPNVVKVVRDDRGRALYFSRSPIPMVRDGDPDFAARPVRFLQHLGLYAYRREFLLKLAAIPPHPLEEAEKLEQLRVLGTGESIQVGIANRAHRGIDTPADYAEFVRHWREQSPAKPRAA